MRTQHIPQLVAGLFDDAAVFPPGRALLSEAVDAYRARAGCWFVGLVGPLVLPGVALPELEVLIPQGASVPLSVTIGSGPVGLPAALAASAALPVELASVEVMVPTGMAPPEFVDRLAESLPEGGGFHVYVELPRDERRSSYLEALAGRFRFKLRTGGLRADLHPDEAELAATLAAVATSGMPFKATAGLHHAVRNTDPGTGFEQHGFLNVLLATDALVHGGSEYAARVLLAIRDGPAVAGLIGELGDARTCRARTAFASIGTCSISDPLADLLALTVLTAPSQEGAAA